MNTWEEEMGGVSMVTGPKGPNSAWSPPQAPTPTATQLKSTFSIPTYGQAKKKKTPRVSPCDTIIHPDRPTAPLPGKDPKETTQNKNN